MRPIFAASLALLALALALASLPALAAGPVLFHRSQGYTLTLTMDECTVAAPLASVSEEARPLLHGGSAKFTTGLEVKLCWAATEQGVVFMDERGQTGSHVWADFEKSRT